MNNEITDLRDFLFKQLESLSDPDCNLDKEIKRSEAMVSVGRVIVDSAKAETDFMKISGSKGSGFIPFSQIVNNGDQKQLGSGE